MNESVYSCNKCDVKFNSHAKWRHHIKNDHQKRYTTALQCVFCAAVFCSTFSLKRHFLRKHQTSSVEFKCHTCDKIYVSKDSLAFHNRKYHQLFSTYLEERDKSPGPVNCNICDTTYANRRAFLKHKRIFHMSLNPNDHKSPHATVNHNNKQNFLQCYYCYGYFATEILLLRHPCFNQRLTIRKGIENKSKNIGMKRTCNGNNSQISTSSSDDADQNVLSKTGDNHDLMNTPHNLATNVDHNTLSDDVDKNNVRDDLKIPAVGTEYCKFYDEMIRKKPETKTDMKVMIHHWLKDIMVMVDHLKKQSKN